MINTLQPASAGAMRRLPGLDLLRAAAIIWVMLYHASIFGLVSEKHWVVSFGWMGVDLFFVLSGFLIAGQLLRPFAYGTKPNYFRFFGRRLLRTLPAYLVVLGIYFVFPFAGEAPAIQPFWQFLTFTENLLTNPTTAKAFSHAWSLCVEEQFYLIFPIVVAAVSIRPSTKLVVAAVLAVLFSGMALRGYLWLHDVARTPFDVSSKPHGLQYMKLIYYPTDTRLDGLLAGVVAAAVKIFRPQVWAMVTARPNILFVVGLTGVALSILFFQGQIAGFFPTVLGFPFLSLSLALVVIAASDNRSILGKRDIWFVRALAAGAYSLYLSHKLVFHGVRVLLANAPTSIEVAAPLLAILGALTLGAALYWLVEKPFLRLRDRLEGPSRGSLAVGEPKAAAAA